MKCSNCGNELNGNEKFCANCGNKIGANLPKNNLFENFSKIIYGLIALGILGIIISLLPSLSSNNSSSGKNELNSIRNNLSYGRAKNCEDIDVKNQAISIFKQHDEYYKDIDKSSIADIELKFPASQSYDSSIDKYECTGVIVMNTKGTGFIPSVYSFDNKYFYFAHKYDNEQYLKGYDTYKLNIRYSSQMSEGRTLVQIPTYDLSTRGQFSCEGSCDGIVNVGYVEAEKARKEKVQQAKEKKIRDEVMVFPD